MTPVEITSALWCIFFGIIYVGVIVAGIFFEIDKDEDREQ